VCIYNSMRDEVSTQSFIDRWKTEKEFFLPVVESDQIVLRKLTDQVQFVKSKIGVYEPIGDNFIDYDKLDIVIVPGVTFDRKCNRIGRGRAYYDRFLPKTKATKIGVCFEFQLLD